jgi:hypothetical protein
MHENVEYYRACQTRERNMGLFVADRVINGNLNGIRAVNTRQNNNGNRNGLECPEERDYYPYWHPTPWIDIGIVTDNHANCGLFEGQSQNVASKGVCCQGQVGFDDTRSTAPTGCPVDFAPSRYNNEVDCVQNGDSWFTQDAHGDFKSQNLRYADADTNGAAPACVSSPFNRDNHLGNGITGFANNFNWTIPDQLDCAGDNDCQCVLRLRYNISSGDYDGWGSNAADASQSGAVSPVIGNPYFRLTGLDGQWNGQEDGAYVRMAIDTTQFGRTFQDRSHVFHVRQRNFGEAGSRVYNLNVRGKRGNIVQTYPATEYDFVPQYLNVRQGDYIHFQWTGCDTNPAGNAGEGTDQTDRSNIVQMEENGLGGNHPRGPGYALRANGLGQLDLRTGGQALFSSREGFRFAMIDQDPGACLSIEQLNDPNLVPAAQPDADQDVRNCALLNGAPNGYFDGGVKQMNTPGTFNYMSTRNNNFTNRGQKAQIQVDSTLAIWAIALIVIGGVSFLLSFVVFGALLYTKLTGTYSGSVLENMNEMLFLEKLSK